MKKLSGMLAALMALAIFNTPAAAPVSLDTLRQKPRLTVLVTDSGLGGLSVCGGLEKRARESRTYEALEVVFCNALPAASAGYNQMEGSRKAEVFSAALAGMARAYEPDLILIACNTLSVVYPETAFSRSTKKPVLGIVDLGVEAMVEQLRSQPGSRFVIFGTETTIAAGAHRAQCVAKGIDPARIIAQACPDLAGEIQTNPRGEPARNLIDLYVGEAAEQLPKDASPVVAVMCCTHYGYCADLFREAFSAAGKKEVRILNPNERMADLLFSPRAVARAKNPSVRVKVVSPAVLSAEEVAAISALLQKEAPLTAAALRAYDKKPF